MFKRRLLWVLANGIMMASGAAGLFYGVGWALNIFLFLAWTTVTTAILCGLSKEARAAARAKGRSIPRWLSIGCDLIIILALAAVGRFVLAAGMLLQISVEHSVFEGKD